MQVQAINNINFGAVRKVTYPKSYDVKADKEFQYSAFREKIDALKAMSTNIKYLLDYNKLTGNNKLYADTVLSEISDKEKDDLTVELNLDDDGNNIGFSCYGYMTMYFPNLANEWNRNTENDRPEQDILFCSKSLDMKDKWYTHVNDKLPVPTPGFLKYQIKSFLLQEGETHYKRLVRESLSQIKG